MPVLGADKAVTEAGCPSLRTPLYLFPCFWYLFPYFWYFPPRPDVLMLCAGALLTVGANKAVESAREDSTGRSADYG